MKHVTIHENESLKVTDTFASEIVKMLLEEPDLPMRYDSGTVSFSDYTVGTVIVGDLVIDIIPRNPSFTLESMFEMLLYDSLSNFEENFLSSGFGENISFGVSAVASQFYCESVKLVEYGITGSFLANEKCGKEINGPIIMEKYNTKTASIDGVSFISQEYTTNIPANQIIKSAIIKILQTEKRPETKRKYQLLLKEFDEISEYSGDLFNIEHIAQSFFSANMHYPIVLEFAIKILKEMKIKYANGAMTWYAFLHNSNDIFEKYVRKVLARGLGAYVTKWAEPRRIAVLEANQKRGYKSYVPDILIDYNPLHNNAKAVLDAKNKLFRPDKEDLGKVLTSADMYQMAFYCDKLKTKLGGLIYPSTQDYSPIDVLIDGSADFRFVLFAINMNDRISLRHRKICDNIKKHLLYYIQ